MVLDLLDDDHLRRERSDSIIVTTENDEFQRLVDRPPAVKQVFYLFIFSAIFGIVKFSKIKIHIYFTNNTYAPRNSCCPPYRLLPKFPQFSENYCISK